MKKYYNSKDRTGEKYITNEGYEIEIIEYVNCRNCAIMFKNKHIVRNLSFANIEKGKVANPYHKSVHGVGYLGEGDCKSFVDGKKTKAYTTWASMFLRCYDDKFHIKQPTYIGCSVHPDWHNLQNFIKWFKKNNKEGFSLDKDILFKGNKVYGPDTCCFVPREINMLLVNRKNRRGYLPIGVSFSSKNTFKSEVNINGKSRNVGNFSTIEEAFHAYKEAKEKHIKRIADEWIDRVDPRVYEAMYNYPVEITD